MGSKSRLSRRKFISTSFTGLAATGFLGAAPGLAFGQESLEKSADEIIYRKLGNTGLKLPIVSMGVMNANNPEIIQAAYEMGVRHFDTAARYQYGQNEQMVGEVIKKLGVRDKVVIGTKEMRPSQRESITPEKAIEDLKKQCEGSLRRLKTDYIDILYVHSAHSAEEASDPGIAEGMKQLKKEGKIRFSGVSTHEAMTEVINEVIAKKSFDVVLTAINVSMADDVDLLSAIDNAAAKGIGIIAMKTQAGGRQLPNRDSLREFSNSTIATASLKWVMRNKSIGTSIPGYDNYTHLNEDFSVAFGLEYADDEKKFLSDNNLKLGFGFCRQCRQCLPTCPKGAEVPALMRIHMYAAQYSNFQHARLELDDIPQDKGVSACASCSECVAKCSNEVDIKNRIENLKLIYA